MSDWVIGIDVGGTKVALGLVAPSERIVARDRFETRSREGPASLVARLCASIEQLSTRVAPGDRLAAVGLCAPGPIDRERGALIDPPNLPGLQHSPLAALLAQQLGLPVVLEHDAKAAAWGEHLHGAGRGDRSMAYIVVGTGVGGAIIVDDAILRGGAGGAGEIGHVTLDAQGERCSCNNFGCVETFLSGPWLARRYHRLIHGDWPHGDPPVAATQVAERACHRDHAALQVMAEAGGALGRAVATLAMVVDVELYVIGGSVANAGELLLAPAREAAPHHCYRSVGARLRLVEHELGEDGPILGCADQARQAARERG
jgi:glucokinase